MVWIADWPPLLKAATPYVYPAVEAPVSVNEVASGPRVAISDPFRYTRYPSSLFALSCQVISIVLQPIRL